MKILTGTAIREADRFTIEHEPIESLALMERASEAIAQWICNHISQDVPLLFVVGKGNNGGDGLAVARMLHKVGYLCEAVVVFGRDQLSTECRTNLGRLPKGVRVSTRFDTLPDSGTVIVDALLGTGVRGEVTGLAADAIRQINASGCRVLSIDVPSGMVTEYGNLPGRLIVHADVTLTLEFPKLSLLLPEAGECAGVVTVLPIGLSEAYMEQVGTPYFYVDEELIRKMLLPRPRFGHKGCFGHALLVCGSEGMVGAAVLAAGAALRSGCGLVTVHLPREERVALQANHPAAMVSGDEQPCFSHLPQQPQRFTAIGVGPGLGQRLQTARALEALLQWRQADGDRCGCTEFVGCRSRFAGTGACRFYIDAASGELRRLVGEWEDDADRNERVRQLARRLSAYVVVKGAHTMVCTPEGICYFNPTGNAGMAKGGSGDVLTGLITGLLARGYPPLPAALVGVYLHGKAGDKATQYYGQEGVNAGDLADFIGETWAEWETGNTENRFNRSFSDSFYYLCLQIKFK